MLEDFISVVDYLEDDRAVYTECFFFIEPVHSCGRRKIFVFNLKKKKHFHLVFSTALLRIPALLLLYL